MSEYYFIQISTFASMKLRKEIKSRRTFLKAVSIGIAAFFVFLWNKLTLNHLEMIQKKEDKLPFNNNKVVSFFDNYIVVLKNNTTIVLSSHCSHLGCKISSVENDRLVCPCHGSEYDLNGMVLKGPAYRNLTKVPSKISDDKKHIEIAG